MTVMVTRQDYNGFAEQLAAIGRPIIVGFEATGNYHRTLAHRLLTAGFELRLISSVALARTREALHNDWDKDEPRDAQVILHMLRIGATQHYVDPLAAGINDLQELSKTHETISRMKTQTWNRFLTHYLPLYFPEIARLAGNSRSDWFLALIEPFPTPATITALDREAFSAAARHAAGMLASCITTASMSRRLWSSERNGGDYGHRPFELMAHPGGTRRRVDRRPSGTSSKTRSASAPSADRRTKP